MEVFLAILRVHPMSNQKNNLAKEKSQPGAIAKIHHL
jgi:hypothetical protein